MAKKELDDRDLKDVQGGADRLAPKEPGPGELVQPGPSGPGPSTPPPGGGGPGPIADTADGGDVIQDDGTGHMDQN